MDGMAASMKHVGGGRAAATAAAGILDMGDARSDDGVDVAGRW